MFPSTLHNDLWPFLSLFPWRQTLSLSQKIKDLLFGILWLHSLVLEDQTSALLVQSCICYLQCCISFTVCKLSEEKKNKRTFWIFFPLEEERSHSCDWMNKNDQSSFKFLPCNTLRRSLIVRMNESSSEDENHCNVTAVWIEMVICVFTCDLHYWQWVLKSIRLKEAIIVCFKENTLGRSSSLMLKMTNFAHLHLDS